MERFFLRSNVQVEPLFDQWYAWPHLIPPATAARNVTERHFKIMDSYIHDQDIHASAVKNPKMLGGPFMDFEANRVEEVRQLRASTLENCKDLLELSSAIQELDAMLRTQAKGFSLQELYSSIPAALPRIRRTRLRSEQSHPFGYWNPSLSRAHFF